MPHLTFKAILLFFCINLLSAPNAIAVHTACPGEQQPVSVKEAKKAEKQSKKWQKLKRKWDKKAQKPANSGLFQNGKFRLGVLAFAGGLLLSALSGLLAIPAIVGYVGVIAIVVGVVFVIWGLLEHFS